MAANALFRPGPMESIRIMCAASTIRKSVHYLHPMLEPILRDTYGCMVYQEQIMRIVRDVAGYSMARSDLVRRAMSKKQQSVLEEERGGLYPWRRGKQDCHGRRRRAPRHG